MLKLILYVKFVEVDPSTDRAGQSSSVTTLAGAATTHAHNAGQHKPPQNHRNVSFYKIKCSEPQSGTPLSCPSWGNEEDSEGFGGNGRALRQKWIGARAPFLPSAY